MEVRGGFLRVTLLSLHFVVWLKAYVINMFVWTWTNIAHSINHKGTKLEFIVADVRDLDKVPQHLAVIVQEEDVAWDDLAHVTTWAFASGVRMVSLYDPCGEILRGEVFLRSRLHHHHQQLFSPPVPDIEVITSREASSLITLNQLHRNDPYRVMILSQDDGRRNIVEMAAEVCESVRERGLRVEQIDTNIISKRIANGFGFPDPECVLVFGRLCSMVGFPPWQLRLTEIHLLPTHHKVSYQDFLEVLRKYSSSHQRHGK